MGVQRIAAIVLALCFLTIGSGTAEYWHNAQHAAEDARIAAARHRPLDSHPFHSDFNCAFHTQLHLPAMPVAWTPLLICLGMFLAFLSPLASAMVAQRTVAAATCRGPPAR